MKKRLAITLCSLSLAAVPVVYAQTGATPSPAPTAPGSPAAPASGSMAPPAGKNAAPAPEPTQTVTGWSVKDKILGTEVYNEKNEKVGDIDDVILANNGKAIYFVVGVGGFIGMGEHDVAIPFDKLTKTGDKLILGGYTKDQLKAMPEVKVTKK